jgi:hypothetical protein
LDIDIIRDGARFIEGQSSSDLCLLTIHFSRLTFLSV